jgi:hypothetical protein
LSSINNMPLADGKLCTLGFEFSYLLNPFGTVLLNPTAVGAPRRGVVSRCSFNRPRAESFTGLPPFSLCVSDSHEEHSNMGLFQARDNFRELRKSARHEIHYLAQIDVEGRPTPLSCIIWDISASGAKLTVADEQQVPDEFTLVFRRHCRVVRRYDGQLGVQFASA